MSMQDLRGMGQLQLYSIIPGLLILPLYPVGDISLKTPGSTPHKNHGPEPDKTG